ncbi:MAG TPA: nitroreductase family protein [Paenirhodobacter sp.]
MKAALKELTRKNLLASRLIFGAAEVVKKARGAGYYWSDFRRYGGAMTWRTGPRNYWKISSELIFQHHKLEKGMCLPPPLRFFGKDAANKTLELMAEWRAAGLGLDHPVYRAALDILKSYRARLDVTPPPADFGPGLIARIDQVLADFSAETSLPTPIIPAGMPQDAATSLHAIALGRRSVRAFDGQAVEFTLVEKALETAQLSPSACNRQPWRIHFYDKREDIDRLLALQNGNSGFGKTVPLLAVVTADCTSFFGAVERIEPILDAGLFLSTFLLALQANGLSSCCLNWCVAPDRDLKAHEVGKIPAEHQIVTFLAIGTHEAGIQVPRSHRRPLADCLVRH